jgi:hypothetical protein
MNDVPPDQLSAGRFAELVRTKFEVQVDPGLGANLELADMGASSPASPGFEGVSPLSPRMDCPASPAGVLIIGTGVPGQNYSVEASTDLVTWIWRAPNAAANPGGV